MMFISSRGEKIWEVVKKKMKKIVAILMAMILVMSVMVVIGGGAEGVNSDATIEGKVKIKDVRIDHELLEKAKLSPNETQRVIILFHKKPVNYKGFIHSLDGDVLHDYDIIEGIAVTLPGRNIERLKELENLVSIQEDREVHAFLTESIPVIKADEVWAKGINGSGKTVCVVDTGIDYNHPALGGCFGSGCKVVNGYDFVNGDADPMDDNGHGTHCAGIVASENSTYKGVAPGASLMAVKVLDAQGSGWKSDVIAGINWCSAQNADVISISLGGGLFSSYCDSEADAQAVNNAVAAGSFVAVASGNDRSTTQISAPACASNATSVGDVYDADVGSITWGSPLNTCTDSTTYADKIVCHCNRNETLDLLAPGALITSTVLNSGFATYGGTSMAAPHVSGAAAVLLEANPTLTPAEVESVLKNTGVDIYDSGTGLTFPRIDILAALNQVSGIKVKVDTYEDSGYTETEKFLTINDTIYIQANVTDMTGNPVTDAQVYAELWVDSTLEDNITLTHYANCLYRGSFPSTAHSIGVYSVNASASSSEGSASCSNEFHLYSGSGVSAYQLDWDDDKNKDYVLENKHLISVYDGKTDTKKSLLYLYQKDIDVNYTLGSISDPDSIGRGEITTSNMKDIKFYSFSLQEGENLVSADLEMRVNLSVSSVSGESETLFSDGFESGDFTTGGWTIVTANSVTDWKIWGSGTYSANAGSYSTGSSITAGGYGSGDRIVWNGKDTAGFTDIQVQYAFSYSTFLCGVPLTTYDNYDLYAEYSTDGGTEWTVFDSDTCGTNSILWETRGPFTLPAVAENNPNFQIRFRAVVSGGTACAYNRIQVDDVVITGTGINITTFNLTIQMKSEDVDYLAYKLHNFGQNISDINDIFPDIAGTFGLSVNDDRYHSEDGSDSLITSLTANQWNNYTNSNYTMVYDNSTSDDPINNNVIALVRFNETAGMKFDSSGLWYDNIYDTEGLRMRYNTSLATTSDEINYILAFTKGDWQTIDQWMPNIAQRQFPTPNFMTPPAAGAPNVVVIVNTTSFGNMLAGNSTEIHVSLTLNNTGDAPAEIEAVFKTNVSAVYGLMNGTSENIIPGNNFKLGPDGKETALTNTTTTTLISILAAGANVTYDAILIVPAGQAADDYNGIVELSW